MAIVVPRTLPEKRPLPVLLAILLLGFLGTTAIAGGLALLLDLGGGRPPLSWLVDVPLVDSYLIPGLVLMVGFGMGSIATTYGMIRRPRWGWIAGLERVTGHHWSWIATILLGGGQVIWIALEVIYLPELSWLQMVYGPLGICLVLLATLPKVREHLALDPISLPQV